MAELVGDRLVLAAVSVGVFFALPSPVAHI